MLWEEGEAAPSRSPPCMEGGRRGSRPRGRMPVVCRELRWGCEISVDEVGRGGVLCVPWETPLWVLRVRAGQRTALPSPLHLPTAGAWEMSFFPVLEIHRGKVDKQTWCLGWWMWLVVFPSLILRSERRKKTLHFSIIKQRNLLCCLFKGP